MSRMKMVAGLALVSVLALGSVAQARPNYAKAFFAMYPDNKAAAEAKCMVCHGEDKKMRNDYGKTVGKAIGATKEMDAAKIDAALKKAAGEKSSVEGKTFGDLLKDGKLPGK